MIYTSKNGRGNTQLQAGKNNKIYNSSNGISIVRPWSAR